MRKASAIAAAALACALVMGLAAPVGAAVNSTVTIGVGFHPGDQGNPFFKGRAKSARKSCMRNRKVVIFRTRNHGRVDRFRSGRTDSRGFWRVRMRGQMRPGGYFARLNARTGCGGDKSRQIAVGQSGPDGLGPGGTGE